MNAQQMMVKTVDPEEKWLYQVGGMSAIVFGIAYIAIIALYVPLGTKPNGAEAWLSHMAGNATTWWAILGLSVLTDFLLVPVALALYLALKGLSRNMMLLAIACVSLFIILDLAITWTNYAALITLSGDYAAAVNDVQRAALVTAATYPSTVLESNLLFVYNTLTLSVGIFLTGFVMLKGIFSKSVAYLGIVTGILGVAAVVGPLFIGALSATIIFAALLTTVWVTVVGYRLYRLGRQ